MPNGLEKYRILLIVWCLLYSLQSFAKYLSLTLVFMQNSALSGKVFLKSFLLVLTKFSF